MVTASARAKDEGWTHKIMNRKRSAYFFMRRLQPTLGLELVTRR